jgi:hypothetical protein
LGTVRAGTGEAQPPDGVRLPSAGVVQRHTNHLHLHSNDRQTMLRERRRASSSCVAQRGRASGRKLPILPSNVIDCSVHEQADSVKMHGRSASVNTINGTEMHVVVADIHFLQRSQIRPVD